MAKRIEYIDTVKGLLILSVVVGHVFLGGGYTTLFTPSICRRSLSSAVS